MISIDDDFNHLELPGEPEPDQPGLYYVTFYKPQSDGSLEDNTTCKSYRARNRTIARDRALTDFPGCSIVSISFHDPELEDDGDNHDVDL